MRILLMTRFYRSGQTTHVLDLCLELLQLGHRVLLAIADLNDVIFLQKLKQAAVPHLLTAKQDKLHRQLTRWKPEIIHNHSAHTLPVAVQLGRLLVIPTVSTVHYLDFEPRELLEEQTAVILISQEMRWHFADLRVPAFVVEWSARLAPLRTRAKRWRQLALLLGQETPEKRENFYQLSQHLILWGWEVLAAGNWQLPGVKTLGWVYDAAPFLRKANLVVGTGRAIREGMAAGCAAYVLGSYCDGLVTPENVEGLQTTNFSGRTQRQSFCPKSAANDLARPDPERFLELGRFGRRYALQHFSSGQMALAVEGVYRQALARQANLPG